MDMESFYHIICMLPSQTLQAVSNSSNFRGKLALCCKRAQRDAFTSFSVKEASCYLTLGLVLQLVLFVWRWRLHKRTRRFTPSLDVCHQVPCGHSAIQCTSFQPLNLKPCTWITALSFWFPMTSPAATPTLSFQLFPFFFFGFIRMSACWWDFEYHWKEWN